MSLFLTAQTHAACTTHLILITFITLTIFCETIFMRLLVVQFSTGYMYVRIYVCMYVCVFFVLFFRASYNDLNASGWCFSFKSYVCVFVCVYIFLEAG